MSTLSGDGVPAFASLNTSPYTCVVLLTRDIDLVGPRLGLSPMHGGPYMVGTMTVLW